MAKDASNLWGIQFDEESHQGRNHRDRRERWMREITELLRGTDPSKPSGMAANSVAQVILGHIAASSHKLMFTTAKGGCGAETGVDLDAEEQDDAHPRGRTYLPIGVKDNPNTPIDERKVRSRTKGTGKGMGAVIEFTPGVSTECNGRAAFEPDDMILHEMVHALRIMHGKEYRTDLAGTSLAPYGSNEEWLAILVENIYRSAKGRTVFRSGHTHASSNTPLAAPLNTSVGFLSVAEHRRLMRHYKSTWWPVFKDLTGVKANFNPIRVFVNHPEKFP
jgi:hypothetical protein